MTDATDRNPFTESPQIKRGERNTTLYNLGCALRGQHAKQLDDIAAILYEYNRAKCDPPLEEREVLAIAESVCEHPAEMNAQKSGRRLEQCPLYWFPFNIREWFSDQDMILMKDFQVGWAMLLMPLAWSRGGYLTADKNKLWQFARAKSKAVFERECGLVLAAYDTVTVNGEEMLRHRQLADQYVKTLELWQKRRAAGFAKKESLLTQEALIGAPEPMLALK